jgi:hypothetical protein
VDCEILLIAPFKKKNLVSSKDVYSLVSLINVMTFQENHFQNTYVQNFAIHFYTPAPRRGRGVYCFTSVRPSKIFFDAFFSVTVDGRNLIFGHKHHIRFHFTEMRINTSKVRLVKSSFGGLRNPIDRAI